MIMLIKGVLALFWLIAVPAGCGALVLSKKKNPWGVGVMLLLGYALLFCMGEVLFLGGIAGKISLSTLTWLWGGMALVLGIAGAVGSFGECRERWKKRAVGRGKTSFSWEMWAAILLIVVQTVITVLWTHLDADDAFYVGTATTAVETNTVFQVNPYTGALYQSLPSRYVLSPFPIWLAVISRLSLGIHPAVLAHGILPAVFIPLAYLVYHLLGKTFFPEDSRARGVFLLLMAVIQMSSYFSVYTQGTFLLVRIWQGKAVLASILLPALFFVCLQVFCEKSSLFGFWHIGLLNIACCLVSSMGIMLAPLMVGGFLFLYGVMLRKWVTVRNGVLCCIPNVLLGMAYLLIR